MTSISTAPSVRAAQSNLRTVRILTIADVHFPDAVKRSVIDLKDKTMIANEAVQAVLTGRLQSVMKQISRTVSERNVDAVAVLGDLTSCGSIVGYFDCLNYLDDTLRLSDDPGSVHIVPGNHDIVQPLVAAKNQYVGIVDAATQKGLPILPIESPRQTEVGQGVVMFSVNSCAGCGTRRGLPESIRAALADVDLYRGEYEGLDTPALDNAHLEDVIDRIDEMDKTHVPILLLHHNMLPQVTPRVAPYTELLNAGLLRSRILSMNKPVIVLHGHIHDDTVEVIETPLQGDAKIVVIGSKQLSDGFAVVNVYFGNASEPLGCSIERFSLSATNEFRGEDEVFIRFGPDALPYRWLRDDLKTILSHIDDDGISTPALRQVVADELGQTHQWKTLAARLEELAWLGHVTVDDALEDPRLWRVRRLM